MAKYRKKPVVIDAIQYAFDGAAIGMDQAQDAVADFMECNVCTVGDQIQIGTLEGLMLASPGDWIIKGVKGEFYPCKPDIFAATYEPAAALQQAQQPDTLCDDCPPVGYPTDATRCDPCPRRAAKDPAGDSPEKSPVGQQPGAQAVAWKIPRIVTFANAQRTNCPPDMQAELEGCIAWELSMFGDAAPVIDKHGTLHRPIPLYTDPPPLPEGVSEEEAK